MLIIGSRYGQALADELAARDITSMVVDVPSEPTGPRGGELIAAEEQLSVFDQQVSGIVHLAALEQTGPHVDWALLDAAQRFQEPLAASAANGGASVIGVTRMGGGYAFDHRLESFDPWHGLVTGFCKSLAHEWPDVRVRAVDFDDRDEAEMIRAIADELLTADHLIEVGHAGVQRMTPSLVAANQPTEQDDIGISEGDVLLITGGARGITATVTQSIAHLRPHVVLLGRTTPQEENPAYAGLDAADLRRAIMAKRKEAGEDASLKAVNGEFDQVDRNREVQANLKALTDAGATVEYAVCDMRSQSDVAALVKDVRNRLGRIDGIIHGAGVIEDKLVGDKAPESYDRVVSTKANGIMSLLNELDFNETRLVVLFSSVSGRFGNAGQTDYAAASEVLNKMAQKLVATTAARVTSINWGPWLSGGMVSAEVERQFAERGVKLIRPDVGCQLFADELATWTPDYVEVVVGGADGLTADNGPVVESPYGMLAAVESVTEIDGTFHVVRPVDLTSDPYLIDHRLDGTPVVPYMSCAEFIGASASLLRPELPVRVAENVLLNKGFMLEAENNTTCTIRSLVTPVGDAMNVADDATFDVVLDDGTPDSKRQNYTGRVRLGKRRPAPAPPAPLAAPRPLPWTIDYCYSNVLFHGPKLAKVLAIDGISEEGMSAVLRSTKPAGNLNGVAADSAWVFDPILLDASLQCLLIYTRVLHDTTPLPSRLVSLELFDGEGPGIAGTNDEVEVRMEMRIGPKAGPSRAIGDLYFIVDGEVKALITDFEGYASSALNRLANS